jgi:hypothetical protein
MYKIAEKLDWDYLNGGQYGKYPYIHILNLLPSPSSVSPLFFFLTLNTLHTAAQEYFQTLLLLGVKYVNFCSTSFSSHYYILFSLSFSSVYSPNVVCRIIVVFDGMLHASKLNVFINRRNDDIEHILKSVSIIHFLCFSCSLLFSLAIAPSPLPPNYVLILLRYSK